MRRVILLSLALLGCWGNDAKLSQRRSIVIIPIGSVPADILLYLQRELPRTVNRRVSIGQPITPPAQALDRSRNQYLGSALLSELEHHEVKDADRIVGVIDADLYAPGLNFIFGQAKMPGRFVVVALPRFRTSPIGRFAERTLKVTTHELGHSFGIRHCLERTCVMHFANSVRELDEQGSQFCVRDRFPR